ncbi:acetyl-CoA hydrolase/transferase family protein [Xanthobacter aminoxidans]|uniref:Acetyl-CoA hydrolase/transferase C-terminal domain-containing protein n=1 Tax=Xanthobacter aminoxidans TaxID=186280 RepID=A0ABW6ZP44_9HYPH
MPVELDATTPDLARFVRAGDTICWGQAAAEPLTLTRALMAQRAAIGGFTAFIGVSWSDTVDVAFTDHVRFVSYCGTGLNRHLAAADRLDILPVHYSTLGDVLSQSVDVLMLQLTPPDQEGRYGFALACEYLAPLVKRARIVIAEVNEDAPAIPCAQTLGPDDIDAVLRTARPLNEPPSISTGETEARIAAHVAALVEDRAVLQVGLGALPDRIARQLSGHRDLGIHTGLINDGLGYLIERGAVTNAFKTRDAGISVTGLVAGTQRLTRLLHRNPSVRLAPTSYTHDPTVLAGMDRFTAINSAVEVDLTGQVNAEVAAGRYVGAVGGAADFLRGAARSLRGLPIIALPATARGPNGPVSRIVARLDGPVSTARSDAGVFVTEYGAADLRGLSLAQRVSRMVEIAAPQFREELERDAFASLRAHR